MIVCDVLQGYTTIKSGGINKNIHITCIYLNFCRFEKPNTVTYLPGNLQKFDHLYYWMEMQNVFHLNLIQVCSGVFHPFKA